MINRSIWSEDARATPAAPDPPEDGRAVVLLNNSDADQDKLARIGALLFSGAGR